MELRSIQEATNALAITGVELMGRPIRVGRPADYVVPTEETIRVCMGTGILGVPGDAGVELGVLGAPAMAPGPPEPDMSKATRVVLIKNMLSEAELGDDNECKEIAEVHRAPPRPAGPRPRPRLADSHGARRTRSKSARRTLEP